MTIACYKTWQLQIKGEMELEIMKVLSDELVGIVAALHVFFLILEMFLWKTKLVQERLKSLTQNLGQEGFDLTARLAANMGLYNGFLAAGLVWGLIDSQGGLSIKIFFLVCIIIAGMFGGLTVKRSIFFTQAVPAALALGSLWLVPSF